MLFDRHDNAKSTLVAAMRAGVTEVVDPDDDVRFSEVLTQQLQIAGKRRERVLAIGAHPDDIEIGCAGTLFTHRRRGDRISLLTLGQAEEGDAQATSTEAALAARLIGAQLLAADLGTPALSDLVLTTRLLAGVVAALDPTVVYVHSRTDTHHDHRAVHEATLRAVRSVPQVYAYQSPSSTPAFSPTKLVPIDDVVTAKADLLRIVRGNTGRSAMQPDLVLEGARHWARQLPARTRYAEPFEIVRASSRSL
jgi:LmbE family N-acetylglucosaminyl deacetylase